MIESMDQIILNFFISHRTDWFTFMMLIVTYSGSYIVVSGLTLLSVISFYIHKHSQRILPFLLTVGGSALTTYLLKYIVDRARPLGAIYTELSPSFPSGHATSAMALYGFIIYVVWKHDTHPLRNPFIIFLTILILLIGLSRLYLGVHYLSDVLVGYAIGLVWLLVCHSIARSKFGRLLGSERL